MMTMNRYALMDRVVRAVVIASTLLGLAGCASEMSARVTSFQQWPLDVQGQTYALAGPSGDESRLEYATYQDMLRAAMGVTDLVQAEDGQSARFLASFRYDSEATQVVRREPVDSHFYGGLYGRRPWGWGAAYSWPVWIAVPESAWRYTLTVDIRDLQRDDAEVYRATASMLSASPDALPQVMPHLMQAVFDGFPGHNGQVREVRYRRD